MKVFVSVPVRGRSDAEVAAEKQAILERVREEYPNETVELIDTDLSENAPMDGDCSGVWYLGKSLELLATADLAVFADGWRDARGCYIEHEVCLAYGIPNCIRANVKGENGMNGTDGGISGLFANTQGARIERGEVPAAAIAGNERLQELSKAAEPLRAYLKKYGDPYTVVVVRQDCATEAQEERYVTFKDDANERKALEEEIMVLPDNG